MNQIYKLFAFTIKHTLLLVAGLLAFWFLGALGLGFSALGLDSLSVLVLGFMMYTVGRGLASFF